MVGPGLVYIFSTSILGRILSSRNRHLFTFFFSSYFGQDRIESGGLSGQDALKPVEIVSGMSSLCFALI